MSSSCHHMHVHRYRVTCLHTRAHMHTQSWLACACSWAREAGRLTEDLHFTLLSSKLKPSVSPQLYRRTHAEPSPPPSPLPQVDYTHLCLSHSLPHPSLYSSKNGLETRRPLWPGTVRLPADLHLSLRFSTLISHSHPQLCSRYIIKENVKSKKPWLETSRISGTLWKGQI